MFGFFKKHTKPSKSEYVRTTMLMKAQRDIPEFEWIELHSWYVFAKEPLTNKFIQYTYDFDTDTKYLSIDSGSRPVGTSNYGDIATLEIYKANLKDKYEELLLHIFSDEETTKKLTATEA